MDLSPLSVISGLVLGLVGTALIIYGKKQEQFAPAFAGLLLCVIPYVVGSVLVDWLIAIGCLSGLYYLSRQG